MFDSTKSSDVDIINEIVAKFNDHQVSKTHSRHFSADFCKRVGLKINMMENDQKLQEKILSMHHAYVISLNLTNAVKIIESQNNKSQISLMPVMM
jgi:hypothetical protein